MTRYLITNVRTSERYEVEAHFAEQACYRVGWNADECAFVVLRDDWTTDLEESPVRLWTA